MIIHSPRLISNATCFEKLSPVAPQQMKIDHSYVNSKHFNSIYLLYIINSPKEIQGLAYLVYSLFQASHYIPEIRWRNVI